MNGAKDEEENGTHSIDTLGYGTYVFSSPSRIAESELENVSYE